MKSTRWIMTYIVVASLGLWGAFFMSLSFMKKGHAQAPPGAPSAGDLPPEFLQETQPPPGNGNNIPPPPTEPPPQAPQRVEEVPQAPGSSIPQVTTDPSLIPADVPVPVVPQFASDEEYNYDPTGRRDPFKPYRTYRPAVSVTVPGKPADILDPLQRWDIDRFAVVAILWDVRQPKAMVRDPDGALYMISKKTKIGRNNGQVVTIREGEVVVVEVIDNEGVLTKEVKILELKK